MKIIQQLIILGFLKNHPCSGYDINKFIEKELGTFSTLEAKSIYYSLRKMEKEGLIKKKELRGSRLRKYIYSLSNRGEREFINLCEETLVSKRRPFIDLDVALYFLPYLNKRRAIARLRLRKRFLDKARDWLKEKLCGGKQLSIHQELLLKHHLNLLNAEEDFVREIIEVVKNY